MPITKTDYEDKKEYWDYQRLIEFKIFNSLYDYGKDLFRS